MESIPIKQWLKQRILKNQSEIVNDFLTIENKQFVIKPEYIEKVKIFNNFLAWDTSNAVIFENSNVLNLYLSAEKQNLFLAKKDIENFVNSNLKNNLFQLNPPAYKELIELTKILDHYEKKFSQKFSTIEYLVDNINWMLIDNEKFGLLLIEFGFPILTMGHNNWWGLSKPSFNGFYKEQKFFNCFGDLKINPLDSTNLVVSELSNFLYNSGLMEKVIPEANRITLSKSQTYKLPNFGKETKQEIEVRKDLSNNSDNKN